MVLNLLNLKPMDVSKEIQFQTTRSGGKGGQNVNKVETAVLASFHVATSALLTDEQKAVLLEKLSNRINKDGQLQVKAQTFRTQLENKNNAALRINELIAKALQKKKLRIATSATKASVEKRIDRKKKNSELKLNRRKINLH